MIAYAIAEVLLNADEVDIYVWVLHGPLHLAAYLPLQVCQILWYFSMYFASSLVVHLNLKV